LKRAVLNDILTTTESVDLVYEDVHQQDGIHISDFLRSNPEVETLAARISYDSQEKTLSIRVMPTYVHNVHQIWMSNEFVDMLTSGFLTPDEQKYLQKLVGTTFRGFGDGYVGSSKEPDLCILPDHQDFPSVVIESGWSESPRIYGKI
jgi:hypothetical protein